ncbi:hypothetical protein HPG69_016929, partial [Diceros bicornis minor]
SHSQGVGEGQKWAWGGRWGLETLEVNVFPKCFFHICFPKDKRGWITSSEGRMLRKGGLRRRLSHIDCGEFRDPKVFCTRESDPHCGSNGQTYGNKCSFCKAVV